MAEGRLLKKNISHSRRLAELKTDSARMLWLMMLPHLDVEGRIHAAPEMVKGNVVPRLKHLSDDKVEALLQDLDRVGLVFIYQADGDTYLQFRKFEVFQNLRPGKEAPSRIPAPDPETMRKHFEEDSRTTPGQLPEDSGSKPGELRGKIREDKRREDKGAAGQLPELPGWILQVPAAWGAWHGFVEFRKKKGTFTRRAQELIIKDLEKLRAQGFDPAEVLDQSVKRGWTGVFEIKSNGGSSPPPRPPREKPKPKFICTKCDQPAEELVEHRGQKLCQACFRSANPEIDPKVKALMGFSKGGTA